MTYSKKIQAWCGIATLVAVLGCGEPEVAVPAEVEQDTHTHEGQAFVGAGPRDVIQQKLLAGGAELRPGMTFRGIMLYATCFGTCELELSYEREDGSRSAFFPVEPDEPEEPFVSATAVLPEPATALFVRVKQGAEYVDFLASRFYADTLLEGEQYVPHPPYDPEAQEVEGAQDVTATGLLINQQLSVTGRWLASSEALVGARRATHGYEGAPVWTGTGVCSGGPSQGVRELGGYLFTKFNAGYLHLDNGKARFGAYECRKVRGSKNTTSMHAVGRAIDLHFDMINGDADNGKGDPAANWLLEHAQEVGIQLVIWDQTSWKVGSSSANVYSKYQSLPHKDHIHLELTKDAAARKTAFFGNQGSVSEPVPGTSSVGGGQSTDAPSTELERQIGELSSAGTTRCNSSTLKRKVPVNTCVQTSYNMYGGRCNWARCSESGNWVQASSDQCPGTVAPHTQCGDTNPLPSATGEVYTEESPMVEEGRGESCTSGQTGRVVPHGVCMQIDYMDVSCSKCGWLKCIDGSFMCALESSCSASSRLGHANCGAEPDGPKPDGTLLGEFELTYYYLADEKTFSGTKSAPVTLCSGGESLMVDPDFLEDATEQKAGKLEDGRVIELGESGSCFDILSDEFPWGKGKEEVPLEPFRSLVTDQDLLLPFGTLIYIKQFDGVQMPAIDGIESFKHDGCFRADDAHEDINGLELDFFAGTEEARDALEELVASQVKVLTYEKADTKCAALER